MTVALEAATSVVLIDVGVNPPVDGGCQDGHTCSFNQSEHRGVDVREFN